MLLITILSLIITAFIAIAYFNYYYKLSKECVKWENTTATIISSEPNIDFRKSMLSESFPIIKYKYNVSGKSYENDRFTFFGASGFSQEQSISYANKYSKNSKISIFFNPDKPEQAVIITGFDDYHLVKLWFFLFLIAIFIIVMVTLFFLI